MVPKPAVRIFEEYPSKKFQTVIKSLSCFWYSQIHFNLFQIQFKTCSPSDHFSKICFIVLQKTFHTFQFVSNLLQKWINSLKNDVNCDGDSLYFFRYNQIIFFLYHFSDNVTSFPGHPHNCPSKDGDELSESDDEEQSNNGYEFSNSLTLKEDHQLFDHTTYERLYNWLYYSYSKNGFMCKICSLLWG